MIWPGVLSVVVIAAAAAAWMRHGLMVITVDGSSMSPTYESGDRVLIRRGRRGLRRGAVIVVAGPDVTTGWRRHPPLRGRGTGGGWYIKRLAALGGDPFPPRMHQTGVVPDGTVVILGDNARSLDSRLHGPCPRHQVLGVVVRRLGARVA